MKTRRARRWVVPAILGWVLLFPSRMVAQAPTAILTTGTNQDVSESRPAGTPGTSAEGELADDQQPTFQVEIEVVTVPVTVTDAEGEFVTDLNPSDFRLRDNGKDQKIEGFEQSWEPISMVVVVETSSRIQSQLAEVGRTGILFTQLILGESGEAAVITFDREIKLAQDFTENADLVEGALKNLKSGGDDVRLSDALTRAMFLLQRRPKERRKVIVVLSEARDNGSSNTPGFVLRSAQQLGISIYTVSLSSLKSMFARPGSQAGSSPFPPGVAARPTPSNAPPIPSTQTNIGAANLDMLPIIEELVSYTKGVLGGNPLTFFAQGTGAVEFSGGGDDVEQALGRIGRELRNQYLLTYRPNNLDAPAFHGIQVILSRPGLRVRTRPGYMYAGPHRAGGASSPSDAAPGP
ncbi:MAG: VWA domain-containing protein [Acidobacteria bacterium]|nr:VWA domain-containing protein [Acidobacteriota bacterium]